MISVRLYASLVSNKYPGQAEFAVEARPGLTVRQAVEELGIQARDIFIILINGEKAGLDSPLHDGDHLGLFPPVSGG
ncbi:MAG: MoaD/ThiS family protein [Firmicutes bacterium]|nr:MoaD/ThiS family protein [Bacillota bacterium]